MRRSLFLCGYISCSNPCKRTTLQNPMWLSFKTMSRMKARNIYNQTMTLRRSEKKKQTTSYEIPGFVTEQDEQFPKWSTCLTRLDCISLFQSWFIPVQARPSFLRNRARYCLMLINFFHFQQLLCLVPSLVELIYFLDYLLNHNVYCCSFRPFNESPRLWYLLACNLAEVTYG